MRSVRVVRCACPSSPPATCPPPPLLDDSETASHPVPRVHTAPDRTPALNGRATQSVPCIFGPFAAPPHFAAQRSIAPQNTPGTGPPSLCCSERRGPPRRHMRLPHRSVPIVGASHNCRAMPVPRRWSRIWCVLSASRSGDGPWLVWDSVSYHLMVSPEGPGE